GPVSRRYTKSRARVVCTTSAKPSAIWSGSSLTQAAGSADSATISRIIRPRILVSSVTVPLDVERGSNNVGRLRPLAQLGEEFVSGDPARFIVGAANRVVLLPAAIEERADVPRSVERRACQSDSSGWPGCGLHPDSSEKLELFVQGWCLDKRP